MFNVAFTETGPSPCRTAILWIFNGSVVPIASNPSIPTASSSKSPCIEIVEHFVNSGSDNWQVFKKAAVLIFFKQKITLENLLNVLIS